MSWSLLDHAYTFIYLLKYYTHSPKMPQNKIKHNSNITTTAKLSIIGGPFDLHIDLYPLWHIKPQRLVFFGTNFIDLHDFLS